MPILALLSIAPHALSLSPSHSILVTQDTLKRPTQSHNQALDRATTSYYVLQHEWYNETSGLYSSTGWWNSANIITTITNLAIVNPALSTSLEAILENTFTKAPRHNPTVTGRRYHKSLDRYTLLATTIWTTEDLVPAPKSHFSSSGHNEEWLNEYLDDEAWWALAWIRAYDLTQNTTYLDAAIYIFEDMQKAATTPCGGIWWDKSQTYVNAITNELYLAVAASLANRARMKHERERYLYVALKQWKWFLRSGMINEEWNINDGLNSDCQSNGGTIWSYNQGVVLEGLSELSVATGDSDGSFLAIAVQIADAAIKKLTSRGIMRDACEAAGCSPDGNQFKGVFLRGLLTLSPPRSTFERFVRKNANSIWLNNRDQFGRHGVVWSGPVREVNAGSHSSALDTLITAVYANRPQF